MNENVSRSRVDQESIRPMSIMTRSPLHYDCIRVLLEIGYANSWVRYVIAC